MRPIEAELLSGEGLKIHWVYRSAGLKLDGSDRDLPMYCRVERQGGGRPDRWV